MLSTERPPSSALGSCSPSFQGRHSQSSDTRPGGNFLHRTCSVENQNYGQGCGRAIPQLNQGSDVCVVLVDPRGQDWWIVRETIPIALCWGHSLFAGTTSITWRVCLLPPAHLGVFQHLQPSWTAAVGYFLRTWKIVRIKWLIFPSWSRSALQCGHKHKIFTSLKYSQLNLKKWKKQDISHPTAPPLPPPECTSRPKLNLSNPYSYCSGAVLKMLSRLNPTLGKALRNYC